MARRGAPKDLRHPDASRAAYERTVVDDFNASTISIAALLHKIDPRANDLILGPKPTFPDYVKEKLDQLTEIQRQLGGTVEELPDLRFAPGCITEALSGLIEQQEAILARTKNESQGSSGKVCLDFIQGNCPSGATCEASHAESVVKKWVADWVPGCVSDGGLFISETLGRETLLHVLDFVEGEDLSLHTLSCRALDRDTTKVVVKAVAASTPHSIKVLDISNCMLGKSYPSGIARLASALPLNHTIEHLYLKGNELGTRGVLTVLSAFTPTGNKTVKVLSFEHNKVSGEDAVRWHHITNILTANTSIEKLSFAYNPLGASGAAHMATVVQGNSSIAILDLYATQLGDVGAASIAAALKASPGTLLSLNVAWSNIGCEGIQALSDSLTEKPGGLEELVFHSNFLGKGTVKIGDLLRNNPTLTRLDMRWTYPTDECVNYILEHVGQGIRELNLLHNDLDKKVMDRLKEKLSKRRTIAVGVSQLRTRLKAIDPTKAADVKDTTPVETPAAEGSAKVEE
eukprot:Sspe_Gene.97913::Locus_71403_Transcript_2_2_Confidence_0.667_Length_1907::g.97913::m.97913